MSRPSLKILIVEPSADLRGGLRSRLEDFGHSVISAGNSAEAMEKVGSKRLPDLVLVSTRISQRQGEQFLEAFRALPHYVWVPVFQLLAPGDQALPGVAGFLELPASARKLEAMLASVDEDLARNIAAGNARPAVSPWQETIG